MTTDNASTHLNTQLREVVFAALDELNELRPADDKLPKTLETALVGDLGRLDSLAFVNLIVILEQRLEKVVQMPLTLLDDEQLDLSGSHFNTVEDLIAHLEALLSRERHV